MYAYIFGIYQFITSPKIGYKLMISGTSFLFLFLSSCVWMWVFFSNFLNGFIYLFEINKKLRVSEREHRWKAGRGRGKSKLPSEPGGGTPS